MSAVATLDEEASGPRVTITRHHGDMARLVLSLAIGMLGLLVLAVDRRTANGISLDLIALVDWIPRGVAEVMVGLVQVLAITVPVLVAAVLAWRREFRALAVAVLAGIFGASVLALIRNFAHLGTAAVISEHADLTTYVAGVNFPSTAYWAGAVGVITALTPWISRSWRSAAWVFLGLLALARIMTATTVPLALWPAFGIGAACGSAALLLLGAPSRTPGRSMIAATLRRAGLDVRSVDPSPALLLRSAEPYDVETADGELFVKVVHRDDREAALLSWVWRNIRVKGIEDERPISSPRRSLDHEALLAFLAREAGVRVPQPVLVAVIDDASALVATDHLEAKTIEGADDIADAVLVDLWEQVAILHERRIVHRWLNTSNVLVDSDSRVWITGLTYADQSAGDEALAGDVAELLASTALVVGPERAVAPAVAALGSQRVSDALQLLQPLALTTETRGSLRRDKTLLGGVRDEIVKVTGAEEVQLQKIERIGLRSILMLVATVAVVYIMLIQFSQAGDMSEALANADWVWVAPILVLTSLTFVAAALSLVGAVRDPIPLVRTTVVQLGQTFLNRFTPCNAGGMALRVRYLQKRGTSVVDGAAAVGLTSAASGVMQVVFFVVFVVAAGRSAETPSIHLPRMSVVALVLTVLAVVSGVVFFTRWGRRVLLAPAIQIVKTAVHTIGEIARSPVKMLLLFGGAGFSKMCYLVAFWASCQAFGIDLSFVAIGAVYMLATTIGSAVPTPGGVGGVEAALVAFLTGAGVDASLAVPAMLLFRLITFWLPVVPGYVAFWYLGKVDAV